jgi:hypothetical protein
MKPVLKKEWTAGQREFTATMSLKDLPSGIYFLQVNYGNHSKTEKIVKF